MLDKKEVGLDTAYAISVKAELYSLIITFSILAFLSVVARLYVRIKAKNQGVEDWLVVAAMVRCLPAYPQRNPQADIIFQIMLFVKTALNSISKNQPHFTMMPKLTNSVIENGLGLRAENLQPKNFEMIGKVSKTTLLSLPPAYNVSQAIYAAMIEYWYGRPSTLTNQSHSC